MVRPPGVSRAHVNQNGWGRYTGTEAPKMGDGTRYHPVTPEWSGMVKPDANNPGPG